MLSKARRFVSLRLISPSIAPNALSYRQPSLRRFSTSSTNKPSTNSINTNSTTSSTNSTTSSTNAPRNKTTTQVLSWVKRALAIKGIVFVLCTLAGLIGADLGYAKYVQHSREKRIRKAFENGSAPALSVKEFLPRDRLMKQLKTVLIPREEAKFYNLITGEHGTGKTTLIVSACREVGAGCVYISVPNDVAKFGKALAEAIGFRFDEYISFTEALRCKILGIELKEPISGQEPLGSFSSVEPAILKAAIEFTLKNKRPPVLIIDNVNRLATDAPKVLAILQDFAKDHADASDLIVVFVASEGNAPRFLQSRSTWSRAQKPVLEIGDVLETDALGYLQKRGVESKTAERAVRELAGGRFLLLNEVAVALNNGTNYEELKKQIMATVRKDLRDAGLIDDSPLRNYGLIVIKDILESPTHTIPRSRLDELVPRLNIQDELLKKQVFAYHPANDTISFQSKAVETFVNESEEFRKW